VHVLMSHPRRTQAEVALGAGIPKRTLIRRMQTGGWTVEEVRNLARYFGVDVRVLLDGPDALFVAAGIRPPTSGYLPDSGWVVDSLDCAPALVA
jgi:hypothetical protein